jgi:hypothetical protein
MSNTIEGEYSPDFEEFPYETDEEGARQNNGPNLGLEQSTPGDQNVSGQVDQHRVDRGYA